MYMYVRIIPSWSGSPDDVRTAYISRHYEGHIFMVDGDDDELMHDDDDI